MLYRKEYYKHPYYFFLREGVETITLYFSVENTLSEARKKDEKVTFNKKDKKTIEKELTKIFQDKKSKTTDDVKKRLEKYKSEIEELVDYDGTFLSSKIPILNPKLSPKGTIDQEVAATRQTNNPVTRGYRVYWGESEDEEGNVVSEIDLSDTFGGPETQDLNGPKTFEKFFNECLNLWDTSRTTDKDNFINVSFLHTRIIKNLLDWFESFLEEISAKFFETGSSNCFRKINSVNEAINSYFDLMDTGKITLSFLDFTTEF
jgi:hypothetical protein